jgi:hypothetical protein
MLSLGDANQNRVPDAFESANIFADQDRDGIPDALESLATHNTAVSSMKIIIDGREFNRVEDLPPDARARYEEAMGKMDANRNGIPDFVEGMFVSSNPTASVSSNPVAETARRAAALPPSSPTITPDTSNGWMLVLAGLFIFLFCVAGAGAVWYFFLR